jgi:uncharacterized damage-inducible protein DinB
MPHPLVEQLRFARSEFQRGLAGVSEEDGVVRLMSSNSISWSVAHMATQERAFWLVFPQGITNIAPELDDWQGPVTPPLAAAWAAWSAVTEAADPWLDALTEESMAERPIVNGQPYRETFGTLLLRAIYHYWYHTGETALIRQQLGHTDLPQFVGRLGEQAPYRPGS